MANLIFLVILFFTIAAALEFQTDLSSGAAWNEGKKCQKQQVQVQSCQEYLRKSTKMSPYYSEMINEGKSWREEFPECCNELEEMDRECRCEAIRQVMQRLRSKRELGESIEMQEMLQTAKSLPKLCRLKPQQRCEISSAAYNSEHENYLNSLEDVN